MLFIPSPLPNIASRGAYTALTPECADFPVPQTSFSPPDSSTVSGFSLENEVVTGCTYSRLRALVRDTEDMFESNTGLLLVTASQACLAVVNAMVKLLNSVDPPVSTLELMWVRMFIIAMCSAGVMFLTHVPDPILGPKGLRLLLCLRGFLGFCGLVGIHYSLEYLSLSDATVLTFLAPMCTAVGGLLFLKEQFTRREALAGIVSFVGVLLIAHPTAVFGGSEAVSSGKGTPGQRLIAVGLYPSVALMGVLGASGAYVTIRAIGTRAHALHSLSFFSIQSVILSTIGMIATKTPIIIPTRLLWLGCLSIIGILGFIGQVFLAVGLQREAAGRGTMAIYTQIIFAIGFERLIFRTVPSTLSIIGTLLILGSALYVAFTKQRQKTNDSIRLQQMDGELEAGLLDYMEVDQDTLLTEDKPTRRELSSHITVHSQGLPKLQT